MMTKLGIKSKENKSDLINLLILLSIAAIIGVYLVCTTVILSRDGVHYIRNAQKFLADPIEAIRMYHPGQPFLIFLTYKFVMLFKSSSSVFTWIYAAQGVSLLCRLLALIPLYFIGKILVGSKKSFWAMLILIMLPYPAIFGSGALREWPHILFLSTGFLFLLIGARNEKWWMFGTAGLLSGIGHTIRPECVQLVVYGIIWLSIRLMWPQNNTHRLKYFHAIVLLLIGFLIVTIPYVRLRGDIFPDKLEDIINLSSNTLSEQNQGMTSVCAEQKYGVTSYSIKTFKSLIKLTEEICDNLMYFFILPVLLGFYYNFRKKPKSKTIESFFGSMFIVTNIILMVLLYSNYGYISRRHCLPLALSLLFYAPMGLMLLGDWISSKCQKNYFRINWRPRLCFFILLVFGVVICLPKLLRPIRIEKRPFREAAKWIKENTDHKDIIGVSDSTKRIAFYAERNSVLIANNIFPDNIKYIVVRFKKNKKKPLYHIKIEESYFTVNQWEMGNSMIAFYALKK